MTQDRSEWRRLSLEEEEEDDLEVGAATETTLDDASNSINNNKAESSSLPDHLEDEDEDDDDFADRTLQQRRRQQQQQQMIRAILFLTFLFESVTCFFRFGLGMESTQQTANTVGRYTGGIRIHHGYLGIVLLLIEHTTTTCSGTASSSSSSSRHYCCCCCHHHQRGAYAAAVAADSAPHWIWWMRVVGWSLIASDLIHHFLVLWPLTGSPHFDLVYPKRILYCMFYGEQISCDVI